MRNEEALRAVIVELRSIMAKEWTATKDGKRILVTGPDSPEFVSELWRIARFVHYRDYVSIERLSEKEYKVTSRSNRGL